MILLYFLRLIKLGSVSVVFHEHFSLAFEAALKPSEAWFMLVFTVLGPYHTSHII